MIPLSFLKPVGQTFRSKIIVLTGNGKESSVFGRRQIAVIQLVRLGYDLIGELQKHSPFFGYFDAFFGTLEDLDAIFFLQIFDA